MADCGLGAGAGVRWRFTGSAFNRDLQTTRGRAVEVDILLPASGAVPEGEGAGGAVIIDQTCARARLAASAAMAISASVNNRHLGLRGGEGRPGGVT